MAGPVGQNRDRIPLRIYVCRQSVEPYVTPQGLEDEKPGAAERHVDVHSVRQRTGSTGAGNPELHRIQHHGSAGVGSIPIWLLR